MSGRFTATSVHVDSFNQPINLQMQWYQMQDETPSTHIPRPGFELWWWRSTTLLVWCVCVCAGGGVHEYIMAVILIHLSHYVYSHVSPVLTKPHLTLMLSDISSLSEMSIILHPRQPSILSFIYLTRHLNRSNITLNDLFLSIFSFQHQYVI